MDNVEVKRKKLYKMFMDAYKYYKKRGITTKCKEKAEECLHKIPDGKINQIYKDLC